MLKKFNFIWFVCNVIYSISIHIKVSQTKKFPNIYNKTAKNIDFKNFLAFKGNEEQEVQDKYCNRIEAILKSEKEQYQKELSLLRKSISLRNIYAITGTSINTLRRIKKYVWFQSSHILFYVPIWN